MDITNYGMNENPLEKGSLHHFLDAYAEVAGIRLECVGEEGSLEFICSSPESGEVRVWLGRTSNDSHDAVSPDEGMDSFDLLESVHHVIEDKSHKNREANGGEPNIILVVFLEDYGFESLDWISSAGIEEEFKDYGFKEIWMADCSTIDPFGAVRLIGLHPRARWGVAIQPSLTGKPFG